MEWKVSRENAQAYDNIGFEKEIGGDPDCQVLVRERTMGRDPKHKLRDKIR